MFRAFHLLSLSALVLLGASCARETGSTALAEPATSFAQEIAGTRFTAEIAITPEERKRGLMYRRALPENHGMLFVFEQPARRSFWMRKTTIPLDIGYFTSDGRLREIYPLYPLNETAVASKRTDIQFCLEMEQGWFAAKGIGPGSELNLDLVRKAIRARGFDPASFGIQPGD
jgi:uncharacterized membrane protein (UPF0127 family)